MKLAIYSVLKLSNGAGGEKWIEEVARQLDKRGHRVTVITTKYGSNNDINIKKRLEDYGINVLEFDSYNILFKIPKVSHFKKIARLLKENEVMYFNNSFALNEVLVYIFKKVAKIKVVAGYHGSFPETGGLIRRIYHRLINRSVSKHFDAHHVLNRETQAILISWGYRNVIQIPNGVNITKFFLSKKKDVFSVMFAGSMIHQKGIDRFARVVETINSLPKHNKQMQFVIFGIGKLSYIPKSLQEKYENVKYFGYAGEKELLDAYSTTHIFVSPSRFDEFPLSPLEAMASGTPVVASDIPGIREIVIDGLTGFLVNSESIDEIVHKILYLKELWYEKNSDYLSYASNARSQAIQHDWKRSVDSLEFVLSHFTRKTAKR